MGTDAGGAKLDSSLFGTMGAEDGCSVGATVRFKDKQFSLIK